MESNTNFKKPQHTSTENTSNETSFDSKLIYYQHSKII